MSKPIKNFPSGILFLFIVLTFVSSGFSQFPGGVASGNVSLWLSGNDGTNCSTNGCSISYWADGSGNALDQVQTIQSRMPKFETYAANFNPGVKFDGASSTAGDFLSSGSLFPSGTYEDMNVFVVTKIPYIKPHFIFEERVYRYRFSAHIPWSNSQVYWDAGHYGAPYRIYTSWGGNLNETYTWSMLASTSQVSTNSISKQAIARNSKVIVQDNDYRAIIGRNNPFYVGNNSTKAYSYQGTIQELIIYLGYLSVQDRQKIESYLAIKYGTTADRAGIYSNYLDGNGSSVYNDSGTYWNRIAGIGKDTLSTLDQRISQSIYSGSILRGSTSTDFTSVNQAPRPSLKEGQYLMWGSNSGSTAFNGVFDGAANRRMGRIWKVENTGKVEKTYFAIPSSTTFPAGTKYMVISSDTTFNSSDTIIPLTTSGSFLTAQATVPDGYYISFAVSGRPKVELVKSCITPANCVSAVQSPGTEATFLIEAVNTGGSAANSVVFFDGIPNNTDFKLGSPSTSLGTSGMTFVIEYSNDFVQSNPSAATWTYTPTSGGGGAPAGFDRNVKAVRWRAVAGTFSSVSPNNSLSVGFTVAIR